MKTRSILVAALLGFCGTAWAASTAAKLEKLIDKEKYAKAWKKCGDLSAGERENRAIRESCSRAELEVLLEETAGGAGAEQLQAHWETWGTTAAGMESKNRHALILLGQAGDDVDALLGIIQDFEGTEAAATAQNQIWEVAFTQAEAEDTASAWARALEAYPDHPRRQEMERRQKMAMGREYAVQLGAVVLAEQSGGEDPPVVPLGALELSVDAQDPSQFPAADLQIDIEGDRADFATVLPFVLESAGVPEDLRSDEMTLTWAPQADPLVGAISGTLCQPDQEARYLVRVRVPGVELFYPFALDTPCSEIAEIAGRQSPLQLSGREITFGDDTRGFREVLPKSKRVDREGDLDTWTVGFFTAHFWKDRLVALEIACDGDACQDAEGAYGVVRDEVGGQMPETAREKRTFSEDVGVGQGERVELSDGPLRAVERVFVTEGDGVAHRRLLVYDAGLMKLAGSQNPGYLDHAL